jgi:MFS family permease
MSSALSATLSDRFRALRHRDFRLFWTGQLISLMGTWMQAVAQGWLMHRLTDSAFMLGLLGFAQFVPVTALSLFAGVIADHVDKRRLILITQSVAMVQAVLMAVVVSLGIVQPWMVLVLALLLGAVNAFDLPGRQAYFIEMVGREDLSNAIALNSAAFNMARVLGPAIAGLLVGWVGEQACFWVNAVSFVAVIISLARIRTRGRPTAQVGVGEALSALRTGVAHAWGSEPIRKLLILLGITAGFGFQYMVLLPVYARDVLHVDARAYGLMVSAFGLGSLIAAVGLTRRMDRWALRRTLLLGLTAAGIGMGLFAWSRALWLTLAMGLLAGFGLILYLGATNTLVQLTTEDRYRGRVMSFYTFMLVGTAPFGALMCGAIAQRWGAPLATSLCALILLGGAVSVAHRLRVVTAREAAEAATATIAADTETAER